MYLPSVDHLMGQRQRTRPLFWRVRADPILLDSPSHPQSPCSIMSNNQSWFSSTWCGNTYLILISRGVALGPRSERSATCLSRITSLKYTKLEPHSWLLLSSPCRQMLEKMPRDNHSMVNRSQQGAVADHSSTWGSWLKNPYPRLMSEAWIRGIPEWRKPSAALLPCSLELALRALLRQLRFSSSAECAVQLKCRSKSTRPRSNSLQQFTN